jgi:hypothetical protein
MAQNNEAPLFEALNRHDSVKKSTELPLFYGVETRDVILPHVLLARVERAANIAQWSNDRMCQEFFAVLRDKATDWMESLLNHLRVPSNDWPRIKQEFLKAYEPKFTPKNTCTNFIDLKQQAQERVQDYFHRVSVVFRRLTDSAPANLTDELLATPDNTGTPTQVALTGKREGLAAMADFIMIQLFIAGMKDDIRSDVMKQPQLHTSIQQCLDLARDTEIALQDSTSKRNGQIHLIDEELEDLSYEELEHINNIRRQQGKPPFRPDGSRNNLRCYSCNETGHIQSKCPWRYTKDRDRPRNHQTQYSQYPKRINHVEMKISPEPETHETDTTPESSDLIIQSIQSLNW